MLSCLELPLAVPLPPRSYPAGLTHLKGTEGAPGQSHLTNAETRTRHVAACS